MKRTFQPNNRRRKKTHGFLVRMATKGGRLVLKRRRAKGRKRLSVVLVAHGHPVDQCRRPHALPAARRIRRRPEFLQVYEHGVRIRARLMTVMALRQFARATAASGSPPPGSSVAPSSETGPSAWFAKCSGTRTFPRAWISSSSPGRTCSMPTSARVESEFRYALRRAGRQPGTGQ